MHCRSSYQVDREKEKELELIKQQYLGGDKHKKRIMKVNGWLHCMVGGEG